jgi:hypothetical protein
MKSFKLVTLILFLSFHNVYSGCPIEVDPLTLVRCVQLDIGSIFAAFKESTDLSPFCSLADRYMECIKTYSRGCIGFYV